MKELEELAKLLSKRNKVDSRISDIIMRPAITGHIGEYIASKLFDIKLEKSATVDPLMKNLSAGGVQLNAEEKAALVTFLKTLSDTEFLVNPELADPGY